MAIVPSNVYIPAPSMKAVSLTYRGMPIARWCLIAWDSRRFFPNYAQHFVDELVVYVSKTYPGRDLKDLLPRLKRPRLKV